MDTLLVSTAPIEILLKIIFQQYLNKSYCLNVVSENQLDVNMLTGSITYMNINQTQNLVEPILTVSEMGCSDYIVQMSNPQKFISAFEKVNRLGNIRRGNKILLFLPMDKESDPKVFLDLLLLKEIALVANLLLIIPANSTENCESYDIVTHKFVGADAQANDPLYLDSWDACTQQLKTNANLFPHDISNMHGKTLKLATFTYKPYVVLDLDNTTVPGGYDGLEMRVMAEFCRWVNCTLQIIRDDENEWGDIFEDGTGNGILGNVVEDRADFGIGALYSWHDSYVHLDFSASLVRSGITCVAPAPRIIASWELPLMAFSWPLWGTVAGTFSTSPVYSIRQFYRIIASWELPLMAFSWPLWGTVAGTFVYAAAALYLASGCSSDKVLLTTFGMMVTQSQPESGVDWRTRSITGWLLVTGLLVDNAYGGGLAAAFTVPKYQGAVDTVQDMLDTRLEWGATHNAWIFSIQSSQDPRIIQLVSQFKTMEEEKLKRNSFLRTMALSIEKLPAGFFAIAEYITKEAMVNMQLMVEDIYYEYTVAMARKNSQYVDKLTQLAGRLHEAGLLQAWETQVVINYVDFKVQLGVKFSRRKKEADIKSLDLNHIAGIFSLYIIGTALSILLFLIEIFVGRKAKKAKQIAE